MQGITNLTQNYAIKVRLVLGLSQMVREKSINVWKFHLGENRKKNELFMVLT